MSSLRWRPMVWLGLAFCAGASAQRLPSPSLRISVHAKDASLESYQQHLISLQSLVDECEKARDAKRCDPALIRDDDRIPMPTGSATGRRLIRYDWLRVLFQRAGTKDESGAKPKGSPKAATETEAEPPVPTLLKEARVRIDGDLAQSRAVHAVADHTRERAVMRDVLAGKEFRNLQEQTVQDSVMEKFARWLNHLFAHVSFLNLRSAWIGRALVWGFILGVCVALVYSLIRLERRWRVKLASADDESPAPGAASARDWQLWLEDARRASAKGDWRRAIHFLYWAAISRLESRRLWPADRARTPREYLSLVAQEDPRKPALSQLTSAFERFWYGGRNAGESDYKAAESIVSRLIDGATSAAGSEGVTR